jgi:hypothetical protein
LCGAVDWRLDWILVENLESDMTHEYECITLPVRGRGLFDVVEETAHEVEHDVGRASQEINAVLLDQTFHKLECQVGLWRSEREK